MDRLSKLTRNELIEMGVTDAETRATLMTAAQLLTDSWLSKSLNIIVTSLLIFYEFSIRFND